MLGEHFFLCSSAFLKHKRLRKKRLFLSLVPIFFLLLLTQGLASVSLSLSPLLSVAAAAHLKPRKQVNPRLKCSVLTRLEM